MASQRNMLLGLTATAMLLLTTGCGQRGDSSGGLDGSVEIDGSSTVYPVSQAIAEEFLSVEADIQVTVGFSGTGGGFKKFAAGEIDIADASRTIKSTEAEACKKAGIEYIRLDVAYDGLAVVVNPKNDWADCLTVEQLKELWRPESGIKKWSDLNPDWPAKEIKLYGPGPDSGTFDYFTEEIVGESKASRADYTASEDDNVIVYGVSEDRYALGYFGYAYFVENQDRLKLLGVDPGDGCQIPTEETVRTDVYKPLSRPLFIYVRTSALKKPQVAAFVKFYLDHVAELVTDVGYVPVSAETAANNRKLLDAALAKVGSKESETSAANEPDSIY
jgi:phosphate transport system substrate-binding protein